MKNKNSGVPFGLPPAVLAAAYFVAIAVTGLAVLAADPMQEMMRLNGAYSDIVDETVRAADIASVVGFGLSCTLFSGLATGPIGDLIGPKLAGLLGLSLHIMGYVFMFFMEVQSLYYASGVCFGLAFQFILNSHLSVAALLPKYSNAVIVTLSSAPDLSLFLPYGIYTVATAYGDGSAGVRKAVLQYLLVFVSVAVLIDLLLLPMKPFRADSSGENAAADTAETNPLIQGDKKELGETGEASLEPKYWKLTLWQQLATPDFWVLSVFMMLAFCRKKHFIVMIRKILGEIDSDPSHATAHHYADMYNRVVPFGFIPAIVWGVVVERIGIHTCLFVSNVLGTLFIGLSLIPSMPLQIVTIVVYIVYQCFIMAQTLAFLGEVYGFNGIATLAGLCATLTGSCSLLMDLFWAPFIRDTLGSQRHAGFVWLGISIAMFVFPIYLRILHQRQEKAQCEDVRFGQTFLTPAQVRQRTSAMRLSRISISSVRTSF